MQTSKYLHRASMHVFVTTCGFFNNSSCSRNTTNNTRLKWCETVSPERTKSRWMTLFFTSCAKICRNIATISSTLTIYVDVRPADVLSKWHRMTKVRLSILVLWRQMRSETWIIWKYARCLIWCLVLCSVCVTRLLSFSSASKSSSNWFWVHVNTVSIM